MTNWIGFNLKVTQDDMDLVERLCECDGVNGSVFIHDSSLRAKMKVQGLINMDVRGWAWATPSLRNQLARLRRSFGKVSGCF